MPSARPHPTLPTRALLQDPLLPVPRLGAALLGAPQAPSYWEALTPEVREGAPELAVLVTWAQGCQPLASVCGLRGSQSVSLMPVCLASPPSGSPWGQHRRVEVHGHLPGDVRVTSMEAGEEPMTLPSPLPPQTPEPRVTCPHGITRQGPQSPPPPIEEPLEKHESSYLSLGVTRGPHHRNS